MTKKKKSSAQDLIDSLLDDPRDVSAQSARPLPPPLPGEKGMAAPPRKLKGNSENTFGTGVRFEVDLNKADPSLKIVGDRTAVRSHGAKTSPAKPADESALSPSEARNAPTLVMGGAKKNETDRALKFDLPLLSEIGADKTLALPEQGEKTRPQPEVDRKTETEVRFGIGKMGGNTAPPPAKGASQPTGAVFTSAEASLKQSESLRIAQMRIHELEGEIERLRRENEKFASAGETLRRRADELFARTESLETQTRESQKIHEEEKKVLRGQLSAKEREGVDLRAKLEETEARLEGNFKRIRVRERELEHRLEIVKMESSTLVSTKDEMIMRLKREIDQLKFETENGKVRSQELYNQYKEKQETMGRVVRALRIALTILEGEEDSQKKNDE